MQSQGLQENRTGILETLLRNEGYLDPRMYECADYCAGAGILYTSTDVIKAWEHWKEQHPRPGNSQINRL